MTTGPAEEVRGDSQTVPETSSRVSLLEELLTELFDENHQLIMDKCCPVPLEVGGMKLLLSAEDWTALRESRSMSWLQTNMGYDDDAWWSAVEQGRLHWVKVLGVPRFPAWQFRSGTHQQIDGLAEINEALPVWWDTHDVRVFMSTQHPQLAVRTTGYLSPAEWLDTELGSSRVEELLQGYAVGPDSKDSLAQPITRQPRPTEAARTDRPGVKP